MPKKKPSKKIPDRHIYLIAVLSSAILILFLLIVFKSAITNWLFNLFISYETTPIRSGETKETIIEKIEKIFSPEEDIGAVSRLDSRPFASTTMPLQGSFGESFSGVGWKNPLNSTVYQDFKTLTISFPPAYEFEEVVEANLRENIRETARKTAADSGETVNVGLRTFTANVEKVGEQYEGHLYEIVGNDLIEVRVDSRTDSRLFASQYPGKIVLASDGSSRIFLLYAAYQGKAFEIEIRSGLTQIATQNNAEISRDYSAVFNARVTEEGAIDPRIFYKDGTWWIYSVSEKPKLLRLRDGMASDLTDDVFNFLRSNLQSGGSTSPVLTAAPAPESNSIYVILGKSDLPNIDAMPGGRTSKTLKVFRLRDLGFKKSDKLVWESLRLNAWEGEIIRGRFTRIDDSNSILRGSTSGNLTSIREEVEPQNIKYFLSNNGGRTWVEAQINTFVNFKTKGGDFRWRAELYPSSDRFESPWIKSISVEYYIIRE